MDNQDRNIVSGAINGGAPLRSYIKTILGKVFITLWDSFEKQPVGVLLEGDPRKKAETSIVDIWSEEEDFFFHKKNTRHFETGDIIAYVRASDEKERTIEEFSDDELTSIINSKFFALQSTLNSTKSIAVLFRIKTLAQELEKSERLMKAIDSRISEVQAEEFKPSVKMEL